ncbi:MAG: aromatic ring-hydroxylating dioxygenase subunit alpha [Sphingomonadales bacterium]
MPSLVRLITSFDNDRPDDSGLPGWAYHDEAYFQREMERVIRPAWQIVCHISDLDRAGAYRTFRLLGESVLVVRTQNGDIRAFSNVCRHRGMRLIDGEHGCVQRLVCPYHAWAYALDGRLTGVPMKGDYPTLDMRENGLVNIDLEIWQGFVFIRLTDEGGPSVAEMMAPAEAEIAPYRFAEMRPIGTTWARERRVNWKNVGDNYSDNLHIPVAHNGLTRLFGKSYKIEAHGWCDRMSGVLADTPSDDFWERFYQAHLPPVPHLPEAAQRRWLYWKLWPNMAFDIYADQIDFMHWVPIGPTTTELRVMSYALPDSFMPDEGRRKMKLVRYANERINRVVNREDTWLIERVQAGMQSRFFTAGPLAASEVCLRSFNARIRKIIPETHLPHPPESYA